MYPGWYRRGVHHGSIPGHIPGHIHQFIPWFIGTSRHHRSPPVLNMGYWTGTSGSGASILGDDGSRVPSSPVCVPGNINSFLYKSGSYRRRDVGQRARRVYL